MSATKIKEKLKSHPGIKNAMLNMMVDPVLTRPRLWLRLLFPFYIKKGRRSFIYRNVRKDIVPFNIFHIGSASVIESFSIINNMVGDIIIGDKCRVGLSNTIIGPVRIENNVMIGQHVVVSALNHNYTDISKPISHQGVSTALITIEEGVWVGANSVITAGVTIGKNSVIAAGSVVTKDVPPFCVAAGSPAKIIKRYSSQSKQWERV